MTGASYKQALPSIPHRKMVQLISDVTAAATAATLLRILDFQQQNGFDLASSQCNEFTPVQSFTVSPGVTNQHWTLAGGPSAFQIISSACNTFLTYPGAGTPSLALRSQATSRSIPSSSWVLILADPGPAGSARAWNIVEASSGMYLTAWDQDHDAAVISNGSPLTLERGNPNDTRQQFWFVPV
ncbi:hypothetical protein B0H14DRAFT_2778434 [Mycena olivaceomarginata]|nr:hypothetical protein B0H14DRAFT_2778434 [Mycena olivaceomarginata]